MSHLTGVSVDDRSAIRRVLQHGSKAIRRIVVIIPAHQEEATIAQTIESVKAQTQLPTMTIVAVNNCTDRTEDVARENGAYVFKAQPNKQKKAGALNLTLDYVMRYLRNTDAVLVMDADTTLSTDFIRTADARLHGSVGGVGGAFIGRDSESIIGTLQRMEYYRYRRDIVRNGERAFVLSGTGALLSVKALRSVKVARLQGELLPKGVGFYDTDSLTEDNEITLAMLICGFECISPQEMTTTTDVMESVGALWSQRDRWYLGALWNLRNIGWKLPWHMKLIYWRQQIGLLVSVLALFLYVTLMGATIAISVVAHQALTWSPFWLGVTAVVLFERVFFVWKMGWKARLYAGFPVELLYSMLLCIIFFASLLKCLRGNRGQWIPT